MVQLMHVAIERRPVNEAVDEIEVRLAIDGNQHKQRHEPDRMVGKADGRRVAVGLAPQRRDLPSGP